MDDYRYLEPADPGAELSIEEYGTFLSERYTQLHDVARLYAQMLDTADGTGDGANARLTQHWERYTDAASTVHRVRHELRERGKLDEDSKCWLDEMGDGESSVVDVPRPEYE